MRRNLGAAVAATVLAACLVLAGCDKEGPACGNGVAEGDEECDGADLRETGCQDLDHQGGTLACTDACTFDESGCHDHCGNGTLDTDTGEVCDGSALGDQDCVSQGFGGGTLACAADCQAFDTAGCTLCGNGVLDADAGEVCDGSDLDDQDCASRGFETGTLACAADCRAFDTTGCCTTGCDTEGEVECLNQNILRTCTMQPAGCLDWDEVDCGDTLEFCNDNYDPPQCHAECFDACPTDGMTECMSTTLRTCQFSPTLGCLDWHGEDCALNGQICDDSSTSATCIDPT